MDQSLKKRRSRNGCIECRSRHRKCDESKPSCAQCLASGKECVYELRLSWGGRPFEKSRFGKCLKADPALKAIPASNGRKDGSVFVYTSTAKKPEAQSNVVTKEANTTRDNGRRTSAVQPLAKDSQAQGPSIGQAGTVDIVAPLASEAYEDNGDLSIVPRGHPFQQQQEGLMFTSDFAPLDYVTPNLHPFSWLSPGYRSLLDHFISCTTTSLSCHDLIRQEMCSILLPMSVDAPHLLSSILCLAATNRISLGLDQSTTQLDYFKATSLRLLMNVLSQPGRFMDDTIIASVLTLCTTDIVSHAQSPGSWRAHLQGAATILLEHVKQAQSSDVHVNVLPSSSNFLWRWFVSIETASLMTGSDLMLPTSSSQAAMAALAKAQDIFLNDEIDDFAGFSTSLIAVFDKINRLALEARDNARDTVSIYIRCYQLIDEIRSNFPFREPLFRPNVATFLSLEQRLDFTAINQAFHHIALLRIYRGILQVPSTDAMVQTSVSSIISLCASTKLLKEPCPRVAVVQPLFAAGCEAIVPEDREMIRTLLFRQELAYGFGNARDTRLFLEVLWKRRDRDMDYEGRVRWDEVMVEKGLDILPY